MTRLLLEEEKMSRKKASPVVKPIGPLLRKNLYRLGHGEIAIHTKNVAELIAAKTGRPMSRQRISMLMNAVNVEPETLEQLAKGLGVKVSDLLNDDPCETR